MHSQLGIRRLALEAHKEDFSVKTDLVSRFAHSLAGDFRRLLDGSAGGSGNASSRRGRSLPDGGGSYRHRSRRPDCSSHQPCHLCHVLERPDDLRRPGGRSGSIRGYACTGPDPG